VRRSILLRIVPTGRRTGMLYSWDQKQFVMNCLSPVTPAVTEVTGITYQRQLLTSSIDLDVTCFIEQHLFPCLPYVFPVALVISFVP